MKSPASWRTNATTFKAKAVHFFHDFEPPLMKNLCKAAKWERELLAYLKFEINFNMIFMFLI